MTKLMRWLFGVSLFMAIWAALVFDFTNINLSSSLRDVIVPMPIYALLSFASYSVAVIGYRVATFNDCEAASDELKKQIIDAREDLKRKGFKFSSD